jgi:hypothetical protein
MALVDDCIKMKWPARRSRPLILPLATASSLRMQLEYIGPKRLIDEVFNRTGSRRHASAGPQPAMERRRSNAI